MKKKTGIRMLTQAIQEFPQVDVAIHKVWHKRDVVKTTLFGRPNGWCALRLDPFVDPLQSGFVSSLIIEPRTNGTQNRRRFRNQSGGKHIA